MLPLTPPRATPLEVQAASYLAASAGYRVRGLGEYCQSVKPRPGTLVLGFAGLPAERAHQAAEALRRVF